MPAAVLPASARPDAALEMSPAAAEIWPEPVENVSAKVDEAPSRAEVSPSGDAGSGKAGGYS